MAPEDANFRSFGRPDKPDERTVDTELLAIIEAMEHVLYLAKHALWAGEPQYSKQYILRMRPLMYKFYGKWSSRGFDKEQ